ncbi:MAG: efflux RND transporter permease subunit [Planctomycetota bacterium]
MTGLSKWGVERPVPVNLLMVGVLISGLVAAQLMRKEFFPEVDPTVASVTLVYPGATPEEVESDLAIKVEDAMSTLNEIDEMNTRVYESGGGITVEFRDGIDIDRGVDEVKRAIDGLQDLPAESEEIEVELFEARLPVIRVAVFGETDELALKEAIRGVKDDLRGLPGMGEIVIDGVRDYEVRVDLDQGELLQRGIALPEVSAAIRQEMLELPGGTVKGATSNTRVRTMGVEERAEAIAGVVVRADAEGRAVKVRDLGTVRETFVDDRIINRFNGKPAAMLTVFKVGDQDVVKIAEMVRAYVAGRLGEEVALPLVERVREAGPWAERLPPGDVLRAYELGRASTQPLPVGTTVGTTSDLARFVEGRLALLSENAALGLVLVMGVLLLLLNWKAAMWVGVGLSTALAGTLVLMAALDITLNLLTMFGLIVVIGLLVDDAIVVAENIQARSEAGDSAKDAAVLGAEQVFWPVVATVSTSIVAFIPLTFIGGEIGDLLGALPVVVACALSMSLVESLMILPSHMKHSLREEALEGDEVEGGADRSRATRRKGDGDEKVAGAAKRGWLARYAAGRDRVIQEKVVPGFGRVLAWLLRHRYETVCVAVALLAVSMGMIAGGRLGFTFLDDNDAETIVVEVSMPVGTPVEVTERAVRVIEEAAGEQAEMLSIASVVGQRTNVETGAAGGATPHVAQMFLELRPTEQRERTSQSVTESIRQRIQGRLGEVERVSFSEISGGPGGPAISVRVKGEDAARMRAAAGELKEALRGFNGVFDIRDSESKGQAEVRWRLLDTAKAAGFDTATVAEQVRGALFGLEAHVIVEDQEDVKVRVRLDEQTRRSLADVTSLWVIGPGGKRVPLREIAEIEDATSYSSLSRQDRERSVLVTAETVPGLSPEPIARKLPLDELRAKYPDLTIETAGRQENLGEAFATLPYGFLAAVGMIYVILAMLFNSFFQPILVMLVIPFATVGMIWGHVVLGYDLTFLSLIGFVALSGIVVNDSLILVQFYNYKRGHGEGVFDALVSAGKARLRAIVLTTVTTVLGLTPLMLEQSFQAKFLIPMAISIAIGLLSATVMILIVLPCMMLIFDDLKHAAYYVWHGEPRRGDFESEGSFAGDEAV